MSAALTILKVYTADSMIVADLLDGTNYMLREGGWGPRVATLRTNVLGGRGPYSDVEEAITLDVRGATAATVLANVATLQALLLQAQTFERYGVGQPVLLDLQFSGGTLRGSRLLDGALDLPSSYNDLLVVEEIEGVTLRVVRQGAWLAAEETSSTSSALANPSVLTATFGSSAPYPSPIRLRVTNLHRWTAYDQLLLVAPTENDLAVIEAETATATGTTAIVADSVNNARGGSVLRIARTNGGSITDVISLNIQLAIPAALQGAPRLFVFAAVRNAAAPTVTAAWQLTARGRKNTVDGPAGRTFMVHGDPTGLTNTPTWIALGDVAMPRGMDTVVITIAIELPPGGGNTLDIDSIVLANADTTQVIALGPTALGEDDRVATLDIDPAPLTAATPTITLTDSTAVVRDPSYTGALDVYLSGSTVAAVVLGTYSQYWRIVTSGSTIATNQLTAWRRAAALTP